MQGCLRATCSTVLEPERLIVLGGWMTDSRLPVRGCEAREFDTKSLILAADRRIRNC
jgi:hypothetical protein